MGVRASPAMTFPGVSCLTGCLSLSLHAFIMSSEYLGNKHGKPTAVGQCVVGEHVGRGPALTFSWLCGRHIGGSERLEVKLRSPGLFTALPAIRGVGATPPPGAPGKARGAHLTFVPWVPGRWHTQRDSSAPGWGRMQVTPRPPGKAWPLGCREGRVGIPQEPGTGVGRAASIPWFPWISRPGWQEGPRGLC